MLLQLLFSANTQLNLDTELLHLLLQIADY